MYSMAFTNSTDKLVYPAYNNVYPECLVSVPLIAQEIEIGLMWVGHYDDSSAPKSIYFGETDTTNPGTQLNPRFMTIMLEFTPTET